MNLQGFENTSCDQSCGHFAFVLPQHDQVVAPISKKQGYCAVKRLFQHFMKTLRVEVWKKGSIIHPYSLGTALRHERNVAVTSLGTFRKTNSLKMYTYCVSNNKKSKKGEI